MWIGVYYIAVKREREVVEGITWQKTEESKQASKQTQSLLCLVSVCGLWLVRVKFIA